VLHREAKEVLDQNRAFGEKLTKLIATKNLADRSRALQLIQEIQQLASQPAIINTQKTIEWEIAVIATDVPKSERYISEDVFNPVEDTSFRAPETASIESPDLTALFEAYQIDITNLEKRLAELLEERSQITLTDVLARYPIENGLYELLAYLNIASKNPQHFIDSKQLPTSYTAHCFDAEQGKYLYTPNVIYTRP
jgi:hypothetical protein